MNILVEQHPDQETHAEVVVDNIDELVLLKDALGDYIFIHRTSDGPDSPRLHQAQELKHQLTDDLIEIHDTGSEAMLPLHYMVEEQDLVKDALKLKIARDEEFAAKPAPDPAYEWLSNPAITFEAAKTARSHTDNNHYPLYKD